MIAKHMLVGAASVALATAAPHSMAMPPQWQLGGTFECVGRAVGNTVKLNCIQDVHRGNTIITTTANFVISGPIARRYIGKHKGCRHVDASETKSKHDFMDCPDIPKWW
jgi:hypothetical protein